jgi:SAM-dependent methyltransferase
MRLRPSERRERLRQSEQDLAFARKREQLDAEFDAHYGLDTGGKIELFDLSIEAESRDYGCSYQAVFPDRFRDGIESLRIDPSQFTFLDIGAGKGRALFLAEEFGFRRIVGIEFASDLVKICQQNLQRRFADRPVNSQIEIECVDALVFPLPAEPIVIYLFNPFNSEMMEHMAKRMRESLLQYPRPLRILYMNPVCDKELMTGISGLRRVVSSEVFNTYEWNVHSIAR